MVHPADRNDNLGVALIVYFSTLIIMLCILAWVLAINGTRPLSDSSVERRRHQVSIAMRDECMSQSKLVQTYVTVDNNGDRVVHGRCV